MRLSHGFQKRKCLLCGEWQESNNTSPVRWAPHRGKWWWILIRWVFAGEGKGMQFPMHWAKDVYFYYGVRISEKENMPTPWNIKSVLATCGWLGGLCFMLLNHRVPSLDHTVGVARPLKTREMFSKIARWMLKITNAIEHLTLNMNYSIMVKKLSTEVLSRKAPNLGFLLNFP